MSERGDATLRQAATDTAERRQAAAEEMEEGAPFILEHEAEAYSAKPPIRRAERDQPSSATAAAMVAAAAAAAGAASSAAAAATYQPKVTLLRGVPIATLTIDGKDRLCLAQISSSLLADYTYNEIHNRRVALGIVCVQCTPAQLEALRRCGAVTSSSRRCGMITFREAVRLVQSFTCDAPAIPKILSDRFHFDVYHECGWGCRGQFIHSLYGSSRARCVRCRFCSALFSPNKFIFHCHKTSESRYTHPDAANFNSWRRHLKLDDKNPSEEVEHAWEDIKALFNGGSRKRLKRTAVHDRASARSAANQVAAAVAHAEAAHSPSSAAIHHSSIERAFESGTGAQGRSTAIGAGPLTRGNTDQPLVGELACLAGCRPSWIESASRVPSRQATNDASSTPLLCLSQLWIQASWTHSATTDAAMHSTKPKRAADDDAAANAVKTKIVRPWLDY